MSLALGTRVGPYEITGQIGAGGMGEVYRATDTTLKRAVAIKVLPEALASDVERLARFQREAEVLAALNHPNIAQIHGLETSHGATALVMELVEGATLADRIAQGALLIDEALPIAKQIAEALEAAHEQGIIHRDLKPANIKLRPDGVVKVLDFGLAKVMEPAGTTAARRSMSPTITTPVMTQAGLILGTAAYMSPEQARGKPIDKRVDIWAFGCVLYEMLAARRPFLGEDVSDVLAAILSKDVDWSALPPGTPEWIRGLLRRCLEKRPADRLHDIGDARLEITELRTPLPQFPRNRSSRIRLVAIAAAAVIAGVAAGAATMRLATSRATPRVTRLHVVPPPAQALTLTGTNRNVAIAPDGSRIAYLGANGLLLRDVDTLEPRLLATRQTGNPPLDPFFSPDGQWVGFLAGNAGLFRIAATGGPAVHVTSLDSGQARGGTWGPDGTIVFATANSGTGLYRVAASDGATEVVTRPERTHGDADHLWPEFLPSGRAVLFTITATSGRIEDAQVAVLDLSTHETKVILRGGSHAHYVATGHLVYGAAGGLRAVPFDLQQLTVTGAPVTILPRVLTTPDGGVDFDIARTGTLVYAQGTVSSNIRTLVWVDRQGNETPLNLQARTYTYARLSPDNRRIALDIREQMNDIWVWDIARETLTPVTTDPALDRFPVWMNDRRLLFASDRNGTTSILAQAADGSGQPERILESRTIPIPTAVTPDGKLMILMEGQVPRFESRDVMMLPFVAPGRTHPLVKTPFADQNGVVSPDGRWLAYESDESGPAEVYVRPFPQVERARSLVSVGGGTQPLWSHDGRELFYMTMSGRLMRVQVDTIAQDWRAEAPQSVFARSYFRGNAEAGVQYDVTADGKRFLMLKSAGPDPSDPTPASIVVVESWTEELKRLAPTK